MTRIPGPWTFTSNSDGYMFYFNGKPMGGAGTLARDRIKPRHWRHVRADARANAEYCAAECSRRNRALAAQATGEETPS